MAFTMRLHNREGFSGRVLLLPEKTPPKRQRECLNSREHQVAAIIFGGPSNRICGFRMCGVVRRIQGLIGIDRLREDPHLEMHTRGG